MGLEPATSESLVRDLTSTYATEPLCSVAYLSVDLSDKSGIFHDDKFDKSVNTQGIASMKDNRK